MVIKTFNLDEELYKTYSKHCKKNGISMSKRVEQFIKKEIEGLNTKTSVVQDVPKKEVTSEEALRDYQHRMSKYC